MSAQSERRRGHLSSFHLEAIRLGVASAEEQAWAEAHGKTCPRCAALAVTLASYRTEFVARPPARPRAAVEPARASAWQRFRLWWAAGLLAPLAVGMVLLVVGRRPLPVEQGTATAVDEDILEKGGPSLGIVARRGSQVFAVRSGQRLQPGDQIRFVLRGVVHPYGLIASVDGAGKPNIYLPYEGSHSAPLKTGDRVEVDGSIVLDDRLGPERIFVLFSRAPLAAQAVRDALAAIGGKGNDAIRHSAALPVGADAQASILLEKVAR